MPSDSVGRLLILAGLWSHEYHLKTKVSNDSPRYKHQHIWGKVIWGHANTVAADFVSIPRRTKTRRTVTAWGLIASSRWKPTSGAFFLRPKAQRRSSRRCSLHGDAAALGPSGDVAAGKALCRSRPGAGKEETHKKVNLEHVTSITPGEKRTA